MFSSGYFFQCMASHPVCCPIVARFLLPSFGVWFYSSICVWPRFLSQGTCCVALATSSLPGRNKKKKHTKYNKNANSKTNETEPFFSFSAEFIQLAPPAEISSAFLSRQPPWPANFCVDNYSQQKKSILYIKKKKETKLGPPPRQRKAPLSSWWMQLLQLFCWIILH